MKLVRRAGVLRPRDLDAHGLPREHFIRLYRAGRFHRIGRGLYVAADADFPEHRTLAKVYKRVPSGFDACMIQVEAIREDQAYQGLRSRFVALLGSIRLTCRSMWALGTR